MTVPIDLHTNRRSITSRINKILSDFGLENAVSGGKYDELRQDVSTATGYWEGRSVPSKPSRLIIRLAKVDGNIVASMPPENENGTFAYANTAKRRVGGLSVRILPVIKLGDGEFEPYPPWEWLLWYCFWPKLPHGSSGQVFDGFDPTNGTFTYMNQVQSYIAAGLVTLNALDQAFVNQQHGLRLTYGEATQAIRNLIQVATTPPAVVASSEREGQT